jgi:hypothetical protein
MDEAIHELDTEAVDSVLVLDGMFGDVIHFVVTAMYQTTPAAAAQRCVCTSVHVTRTQYCSRGDARRLW